jgi:predicted dinucleotide-binding enzyme
MKIGVLGTGSVGQTISGKLIELGHEAMIGTRDVKEAISRTSKDAYGNPGFGDWLKANPGIKPGTFAESTAFGEIVINATMGGNSVRALQTADPGDLKGKIIIDLANPLDFSKGMPPSLIPALSNTNSLGEELQNSFPQAHIVKTLNTMWCGLMVNPTLIGGGNHINFLCGNNTEAKTRVRQLLYQFGWKNENLLDLGDITNARGTEALLHLWLRVWFVKQSGVFNFTVVS